MPARHELVELLRAAPDLARFDDRLLAAIVEGGHDLTVARGTVVAREGAADAGAIAILEGEADVFSDGELIVTLGPGSVVATWSAGPRLGLVTVRARTQLRFLRVGEPVVSEREVGAVG